MKHFNYLSSELFFKDPLVFDKYSNKEILKYALGAILFIPSIKENLFDTITTDKLQGATSIILCFEDSIKDEDIEKGEKNILKLLKDISSSIKERAIDSSKLPLIFLRVRNEQQFISITSQMDIDDLKLITGFVFPKFSSQNAKRYLTILDNLITETSQELYAIPILETEDVIYKETRFQELNILKNIFASNEHILNIMVGTTDFCSLYGIRRPSCTSIYDISVIADCLMDINNFFNRKFEELPIIGSVWEYFDAKEYDLEGITYKQIYKNAQVTISEPIDGLVKETILDKYNGFSSKSTIHPCQLKYINATYAVTYEEYSDAKSIIENKFGGAFKSTNGNKMNEPKPHFNWARKVMIRARIFGVLKYNVDRISLVNTKE